MRSKLSIRTSSRYPASVEVAAYYLVSEALTNTAKHANGTHADVVLWETDGTLRLRVSDDGAGGAQPQEGTGLTGLHDRVEALGGSIEVTSPVGHGAVLEASLPTDWSGWSTSTGTSELS